MRTEEQIIYDLLNIIHGGNVSDDDVDSERLVRSFVRKHRASKLDAIFNKGATIPDLIFQPLGNLKFEKKDLNEYSVTLPALINFEHSFGVKISKNRFKIPLLSEESYELSLSNPINKDNPKAKLEQNELTIFIGKANSCNYLSNSLKESTVEAFVKESELTPQSSFIYANVKAVLYDPDQGLNYDWTKTPYPCPSEIIDSIETSTLHKDFQLMIRQLADQADNKTTLDQL